MAVNGEQVAHVDQLAEIAADCGRTAPVTTVLQQPGEQRLLDTAGTLVAIDLPQPPPDQGGTQGLIIQPSQGRVDIRRIGQEALQGFGKQALAKAALGGSAVSRRKESQALQQLAQLFAGKHRIKFATQHRRQTIIGPGQFATPGPPWAFGLLSAGGGARRQGGAPAAQPDEQLAAAERLRRERATLHRLLDEQAQQLAANWLAKLATDTQRTALFEALAAELPKGEWQELRVAAGDERNARRRFPKARVLVDAETVCGLQAEAAGGRIQIDNRLETRLRRAWPELMTRLWQELQVEFEADDADA